MTYFLLFIASLFMACEDSDSGEPVLEEASIAVSNATVIEGDDGLTTVEFDITVSGAYKDPITATYATKDASAFASMDYEATSGAVTFTSPEDSKTVTVNVLTDEWKEGDESFQLVLTDVGNASVFTGTGTATIRNDDEQVNFPPEGYTTPTSYDGWEMTWADEFDGETVNRDDWTFEIGDGCPDICGWGNNELEWYTDRPENVRIEDGMLIIEARNDNWEGHPYTSTRMKTQDKQTFQFGRIDIRAKLPKGQGIWPALWMLGNDIPDVGWPACGEIDIMEIVGHEPDILHGTAHWGSDFSQHKFRGDSYELSEGDFSDNFHVFSIAWYNNVIYWYVDDILYYQITSKDMQGQPYPFNDQFFLLFNVAVGGNWPGAPDETTVFPQQMVVDYVRVFQQK